MNGKKMFTARGIVCLLAVILIGVLSIFSPIKVTARPSESTAVHLATIAAAGGDDSDAMEKWVENLANSVLPEKELSEEETEQLLIRIVEAEQNEKELKDELYTAVSAYTLAYEARKALEEATSKDTSKIKELDEQLDSISKELDEMFGKIGVAQSVTLSRIQTKGVTISFPFLDFLTNITGSINAAKLYFAYMSLDNVTANTPEKTIEALTETILDENNYKGITTSSMNVALLMSTMFNQDGAVYSPEVNYKEENRYSVMYKLAYGEDKVIDGAPYFMLSLAPMLLGTVLFLVSLITLVVLTIISIISALKNLKDSNKLSESAIKRFDKVLLAEVAMFCSTIICGAGLSVVGIIMIIVSMVAVVINAVGLRLEKRSKQENGWLNVRQINGTVGAAAALTVAILTASANPFVSWNSTLLAVMKKGLEFSTASTVVSIVTLVINLFGLLFYSLAVKKYLNRAECVKNVDKKSKNLSTRQSVGIVITEYLTIIILAALMILGVPVSGAAITSLIMAGIIIVTDIVCKKLCSGYRAELSEEKVEELENCGITFICEQPQSESVEQA